MTDENDGGAEIIHLARIREDGLPITSESPFKHKECPHHALEISEHDGKVSCKKCKINIDPFAALLLLSRNGDYWHRSFTSVRHEVNALEQKREDLEKTITRRQALARRLPKETNPDVIVVVIERKGEVWNVESQIGHEDSRYWVFSPRVHVMKDIEEVVESIRLGLASFKEAREKQEREKADV